MSECPSRPIPDSARPPAWASAAVGALLLALAGGVPARASESCAEPLSLEASSPAHAVASAWLGLVDTEIPSGDAGALHEWLRAVHAAPSATELLALAFPVARAGRFPLPPLLSESLERLAEVKELLSSADDSFGSELSAVLLAKLRARLSETASAAAAASHADHMRIRTGTPVVKLAEQARALALGKGERILLLLPDRRVEVRSSGGLHLASERMNGSDMVRMEKHFDGGAAIIDETGILPITPDGRFASRIPLPPTVTPLSGATRLRAGRGYAFCGRTASQDSWISEGRLYLLNVDGSLRSSVALESGHVHAPFELPNGNLLVRYSGGVYHVLDSEGTQLSRVQREDHQFLQDPLVLPGSTPDDAVLLFHSPGGKYLFTDVRGVPFSSPRFVIPGLYQNETLPPVPLPDGTVLLGGIAGVSDHLRRYGRRGEEIFEGGFHVAGALLSAPVVLPAVAGEDGYGLLVATERWGRNAPHGMAVYRLDRGGSRKGAFESTWSLPFERVGARPLLYVDGIAGEPRLLVPGEDGSSALLSVSGETLGEMEAVNPSSETPEHLGDRTFLWQGHRTKGLVGSTTEVPLVLDFDAFLGR